MVAALSDARREVQAELETSPDQRDSELAGLGEWAAVTVLAAAGSVPVLDPDALGPGGRRSRPGRGSPGWPAREDWYFVGRRREQRRWPADLTGPELAGIVVLGIGGTGKTTLAAELTTRVLDREPGRIAGQPDRAADPGKPARRGDLRDPPGAAGPRPGQRPRSGPWMSPPGRTWAGGTGWRILRGHVLDQVPVLLLLDNFEDNLHPGENRVCGRDEVLAGLLAALGRPIRGRTRLLVTSRHPFTLPGGAEGALVVPAAGGAVAGGDDEAGLVAARPGPAR